MGDEVVETLAKLLHEAGRAAVELKMVYRNDLPVAPFAEWDELHEDAKTGKRMMASYVIEHAHDVIDLLEATLPPPESAVAGGKGHADGAV